MWLANIMEICGLIDHM